MKKIKEYSVFENIGNAIFNLQHKLTYNKLTDLNFKMDRYIRLVVDRDMSALKLYKLPIQNKVLLIVFEELMTEYATLTNNKEVEANMKAKTTLETLVRKQNILVSALMVLQVNPNDENTIAFLKRSRITGENLIERLQNEISIVNIRIEEQKNAMPKAKKEESKVTLTDYMRMFAVLNKNGYKAGIEMSVLEFIQANTLFRQECENNEKQIEKLKSKR
jgi:hypothetical protein